jgi:hypothetical protein
MADAAVARADLALLRVNQRNRRHIVEEKPHSPPGQWSRYERSIDTQPA